MNLPQTGLRGKTLLNRGMRLLYGKRPRRCGHLPGTRSSDSHGTSAGHETRVEVGVRRERKQPTAERWATQPEDFRMLLETIEETER